MGVLVIMKVTARRACVVSVEGEDNNRHNSIHLKSATSLRRAQTKEKGVHRHHQPAEVGQGP
jgi:hypothetical protein